MTSRKRLDRKLSTSAWETPRVLFDALNNQYGPFTLDPACRPHQYTAQHILNAGGSIYVPPPPSVDGKPTIFGPTGDREVFFDGLKMGWSGRVYLNPPYDVRSLQAWTAKAVDEVLAGRVELVCALLPVKSEQGWWQEFVLANIHAGPSYGSLRNDWTAECREPDDEWTPGEGSLKAASAVIFLPSRQKFNDGADGATFSSAVVVWRR